MAEKEAMENLFTRLSAVENKQSETNGRLETIIVQNERLIKLLGRVVLFLCTLVLIMLFAIIYGALGDKGFNAVKGAVPIPATAGQQTGAIPWDGDKYQPWRRKV